MEEDDDDFYGAGGFKAEQDGDHTYTRNQPQDSQMGEDDDSEEESSDDVRNAQKIRLSTY